MNKNLRWNVKVDFEVLWVVLIVVTCRSVYGYEKFELAPRILQKLFCSYVSMRRSYDCL